ncbi:MAG TPA: aspartate--tRNA ligase [Acidimicrobiia bacterium]|nr:aspartate--tRNA ligase [Acidimicrobiia bacterium]
MDEPLRTARAGALGQDDAGTEVRLAGWVSTIRDHGGVLFFDLREATGLVQVVVDPTTQPEAAVVGRELRDEFCVTVTGVVRPRPAGTANPDLPSGAIEVAATAVRVLSPSDPLPFRIDDRSEVDESRRLEFRYLDLRRPRMAANLRARSRAIGAMRTTMLAQGFLEVETPTLVKSTPEGARDVLVPSRLRPGSFYALPQSPQLFKQILMVGGVERYYQIARCYRDEDFRSDRQIEFTQLDIEGSFWGREDVFTALEPVIAAVARELRGIALDTPFPRMTWSEAMRRFGSDKPDTRFGMELVELDAVFAATGFQAFAAALASGGLVAGINAGPGESSRSTLDGLVERARELGARGLVWAVVEAGGVLRSPVSKHLSPDEQEGLKQALDAAPGDRLLVVADRPKVARSVLGGLRLDLGRPSGHETLHFLWVVDFPVFAVDDDGGLTPEHHPFTAPYNVTEMRDDPEHALSRAYDLVVNGVELGSGSERIHDPRVQREVFSILGISEQEAESRFGWFMRALRYGTPPHAGFAVGLDRLVMVLQGEPNIREVMPFPKTQTGYDPMTDSPSLVDDHQLQELGIDLRPEVRAALSEPPAAP